MSVEIKVRPLTVEDVFAVARMMSKITKGARAELATAIIAMEEAKPMSQEDWGKLSTKEQGEATKKQAEAQAKKPNSTELGMALFQSMFAEAEADLKVWLASLVGKPLEEFATMPATTVIDIVDSLIEQEGIKDFFVKASQLATKATETS